MHGDPSGTGPRFSTGRNGETEDRGPSQDGPAPAAPPDPADDDAADEAPAGRGFTVATGAIWAVAALALIVLGTAFVLTRHSAPAVGAAPPAGAATSTTPTYATVPTYSYPTYTVPADGGPLGTVSTTYKSPREQDLVGAKVGDCLDGAFAPSLTPCSGFEAAYRVAAVVASSTDCKRFARLEGGVPTYTSVRARGSNAYLCMTPLEPR